MAIHVGDKFARPRHAIWKVASLDGISGCLQADSFVAFGQQDGSTHHLMLRCKLHEEHYDWSDLAEAQDTCQAVSKGTAQQHGKHDQKQFTIALNKAYVQLGAALTHRRYKEGLCFKHRVVNTHSEGCQGLNADCLRQKWSHWDDHQGVSTAHFQWALLIGCVVHPVSQTVSACTRSQLANG